MSVHDLYHFDPTEKQAEILRVIFAYFDAGKAPTYQQIKDSLSYGPAVSMNAIRCSLRILAREGAIVLVYGDDHLPEHVYGMKGYAKPTPAAYRRFRVTGAL